MKNNYIFYTALTVMALFLGYLLIHSPNIQHAPHLDDLNSGGFRDAVFALVLAGLVLFLAAGLGIILLRPFKLGDWSFIERTVISLPLGLAAIGYAEFFMGLLGWLKPIHHTILLVIFAIIAFKNSVEVLTEGLSHIKRFPEIWRGFSFIKKFFFTAGALALMLAFLQTLTPPWDYDGLMYHLQGPRLFLDAGKIIPIPENWLTYYPFIWQMLNMLGMGLGSDIVAKVINFSFLIILLLSTYAFCKKWISEITGFLSIALLLGTPILITWGVLAYVDIAWSVTQFLAINFALLWSKERSTKFLLLAGVFQGLALSTKYMALWGLGIIVLFICLQFLKNIKSLTDLKSLTKEALCFVFFAVLFASPWYLKNIIWTGNPIFPFFLQQKSINPVELEFAMDYTRSFGTGKNWYDYLLLPISLYIKYYQFGTFLGDVDFPNPVFLSVFILPFIKSKIPQEIRKLVGSLSFFAIMLFITWATGMQQNRFLLPVYPLASILSAVSITTIINKSSFKKIFRVLTLGIIGGTIFVSFVVIGRLLAITHPLKVLLGAESKAKFLGNIIDDFKGIEYINDHLSSSVRVFLPWDGRGYYCIAGKCIADVSQAYWTTIVKETEVDRITVSLIQQGITHLQLNLNDALYFVYSHDEKRNHQKALNTLVYELPPKHLRKIWVDENIRLYELLE
ncbi:MAG TPA: hypothetical protein PLK24_09290 [Atribacter sp.]|uniref:ArnT family glycosyltransferase n=1 Tax=Atribacter sp. TaxID=2847780 RepID=UPI002D05EC2F|nr:hypothetical protein [Atribacter sp.]HQK84118.1 hypothetical protein [Atribacter sp.]